MMYANTKGADNNKPSNLSSIPPCPGKMVPESLIFMLRLKSDSTRSPSEPIITIIKVIMIQLETESSVKYFPNRIATARLNKPPPIEPSQDFFGDTLSNNSEFSSE